MFQDIVLNHKKTSLYTYGKNNEQDSFTFKRFMLIKQQRGEILGIIIDFRLNFNNNINKICRNACQKVSAVSKIAENLTVME